jgi:MOSC domain-containing protein YiiM
MQVDALRQGTVVAVCSSPDREFPTYPQESITIGEWGVEGDAHSGPTRKSFREPGKLKRNDRSISWVSEQVREELNGKGYNIEHGDFNEQVVVSNLGDLGNVQIGNTVVTSSGLLFRVTDHAYPCLSLEEHNGGGLIKELASKQEDGTIYSRRGMLTEVLQSGILRPEDRVFILPFSVVKTD